MQLSESITRHGTSMECVTKIQTILDFQELLETLKPETKEISSKLVETICRASWEVILEK